MVDRGARDWVGSDSARDGEVGEAVWRGRRTPRRIVCLTEETTEALYRMGEADRIVGISAFTVRPPQARREKPPAGFRAGGRAGAQPRRVHGLVVRAEVPAGLPGEAARRRFSREDPMNEPIAASPARTP